MEKSQRISVRKYLAARDWKKPWRPNRRVATPVTVRRLLKQICCRKVLLFKLFISFLHILQTEHFQRSFPFGLAADQLVNLPEAAWVNKAHLECCTFHQSAQNVWISSAPTQGLTFAFIKTILVSYWGWLWRVDKLCLAAIFPQSSTVPVPHAGHGFCQLGLLDSNLFVWRF